jgi:hypothetical protein
VAGYAVRYSRQARFVRPALVDGTPGLAIVLLGRVIGALGFTFRAGAIIEIEMIDIPDRLRRDVAVSRGEGVPLPTQLPARITPAQTAIGGCPAIPPPVLGHRVPGPRPRLARRARGDHDTADPARKNPPVAAILTVA